MKKKKLYSTKKFFFYPHVKSQTEPTLAEFVFKGINNRIIGLDSSNNFSRVLSYGHLVESYTAEKGYIIERITGANVKEKFLKSKVKFAMFKDGNICGELCLN